MERPFRDNPERVLDAVADPARPQDLLPVVRAIVPAWAEVAEAAVEPVHGGITNALFKLTAPGREPVLVRIYGPATEVIIDREGENRLFARLSREGFAPPYHGRFRNGRVEGWLEGFRPLTPAELGEPDLRRLIAGELRRLHAIPPASPEPTLWRTLDGWMRAARAFTFADPRQAGRYAALDLPRRAATLEALRQAFEDRVRHDRRPGARAALRPVLAHNDLLSGNVLVDAGRQRVRFVDYEYGACSYAGFDVANHLCEHAGFDSDFERGFPSREAREDFARHYLGDEAQVAAFSDVVEFFVLPDHLFWGTWAVIQAKHSPIDFDFMGYAGLRFAGLDLHLRTLGAPLAQSTS